jgi:hypothetical protein
MALLNKIRSATLIEALVATVLIVIVFIVASLILNNLLLNSFSNNTHAVENRMHELEYQYNNNLIITPYKEEFGNWHIQFETQQAEGKIWLNGTATNIDNNKEVVKNRICSTQK